MAGRLRFAWLAACALAAVPLPVARAGAAEPPSLEDARRRLEAGEVDEVYLAFAAVKRGAHPAGDQKVSAFLVEAARVALLRKDPSLALGLTDKARALDPKSVEACLAAADAAEVLEQRGAVEEALEAALKAAPRHFGVVLRRARLSQAENDLERALRLYKSIPTAASQGPEAKVGAAQVAEAIARRDGDLATLKRIEGEAARRRELAGHGVAPPEPARSGSEAEPAQEGGNDGDGGRVATGSAQRVAGMAARSSRHFRIVYNDGQRDFAQKANYEQRVLDMFERAYERVASKLGHSPAKSIDVVLYTREEFSLHFGGQFGGNVLGFYSGKIRMNLSENLNEQFFATAVHEYTHAAIDSLASARGDAVPTWLNEGLAKWMERAVAGGDFVSFDERAQLRIAKASGELMTLSELAEGSFAGLGGRRTALAYAKGSCAVEVLVRAGGGLPKIARVIAGLGRGTALGQAFTSEFGERRLATLDGDIDQLIGQ